MYLDRFCILVLQLRDTYVSFNIPLYKIGGFKREKAIYNLGKNSFDTISAGWGFGFYGELRWKTEERGDFDSVETGDGNDQFGERQ